MLQLCGRGKYCIRVVSFAILVFGIGISPILPAESLGRLFTTPSQRAYIDKFKSRYIKGEKIEPVVHTEPKHKKNAASVEMPITYNGLVKRSNGKNVVWVNGVLVDSDQAQNKSHQVKVLGNVSRDNSVIVKPQGSSRVVRLKPGQKWIPEIRAVTDPHQSTTIKHKKEIQGIIKIERHK